jgi:hypothetical protein
VILRLPKILVNYGTGVMEYWGADNKDINPQTNTPTLQYSNTLKLVEIETSHEEYLLLGYGSD